MATVQAKILERNRTHPIRVVSPEDFTLGPESPMATETVLADPRYSLYCFDLAADCVWFVFCPRAEAVEQATFVYQTQAECATAVVKMPIAEFLSVGQSIPSPKGGTIFVHSVGRCGSTLVSGLLRASAGTLSLSEPDELTQLARIWVMGGQDDSAFVELIQASTRWRGKPASFGPPTALVVKTRAEVLTIEPLLACALPEARVLFLYRDAVSWAKSVFRGFPKDRDMYDVDLNRKLQESWSQNLPILATWASALNPVEIRTLAWVSCMEAYLELRSKIAYCAAARYEDIVAQPKDQIRAIFEFLGLALPDWSAIQAILDEDSQAGTIYDREERKKNAFELTPELIAYVQAIVSDRPKLGSPGVCLDGTLLVGK